MKINKSQIKDLLKEVVIELISNGEIQIKQSLVNELKVSNGINRNNLVQNKKVVKSNNVQRGFKQVIKQQPKEQEVILKATTGNPLLDQYINAAPKQELIESSQYVANASVGTENIKDYSEFIKDL